MWRITPSAGKKDSFLNSYGIVPLKPKPKLRKKPAEVEFVEKIPDIKASFDREGDDLYIRIIGEGVATINFLMDVDDNLRTSGLAASEIVIDTDDQPLTLKRSLENRTVRSRGGSGDRTFLTGLEQEKVRGSGEFTGGKKYRVKILGGSSTSGFKTIDKTVIGIDDDISNGFDENIGFRVTSINPKPITVHIEVKVKEPKNDINNAEV